MPPKEPRQTRPRLDPAQRCAEGVAAMMLACAGDFERHRAQLMWSEAATGPHGARVALRRLRTVLGAFAPVLRQRGVRALQAEARAHFRRLGSLRDADVMAGEIAEGAEAARFATEASAVRAQVRRALQEADAAGFAGRVEGFVGARRWWRRKARAAMAGPLAPQAAWALEGAWATLRGHGRRLARMPDEERHGFRKDLKALRYLCDFFGGLWPGAAQRDFLAQARTLQDALGTLNDLAVAEARLGRAGRVGRRRVAREALDEAEQAWKRLRKAGRWWREAPGR